MERRDIFRRVLENPNVYSFFQHFVGADRGRRIFVSEILNLQPGSRVLDVGCGPADILKHLPNDIDYVGIDYSSDYIEAARKSFGSRGRFFVSDVAQLKSIGERGFDVAFAVGLLHHLKDDTVRGLMRDVHSVLKPGGRFVTLDGAIEYPQNPIARVLARLDRGQFVRTAEEYAALGKSAYRDVSAVVRHDLLRIPYSHAAMECYV